MDGWMDGRVETWMKDGWMDGWEGGIDRRTNDNDCNENNKKKNDWN